MLTNPTFYSFWLPILKNQSIQEFYISARLRHHRFDSRKMLAVFGIEDILDRDNRLMLELPQRESQLEARIVDDVSVGRLLKFTKSVLTI